MKITQIFYPIAIALLLIPSSCNDGQKADQKSNSEPDSQKVEEEQQHSKTILFFGNSLTAGYGVREGEGFPELIGKKLDSLGYDYRVINAGVSGETTSSGLRRVDWVVERQDVDIFILELGANDGLRGIPTHVTRENLYEIISKVREVQPEVKIILAGMMVPPNMGEDYGNRFSKIFPEVADSADVKLIPFLLEDVGGIDSLNQDDGIHPNPAGHKILSKNVWNELSKELE